MPGDALAAQWVHLAGLPDLIIATITTCQPRSLVLH
jgi:hypothetical protein